MNIIKKILKEAEAYTSLDLIESSLEGEQGLSHYPVQPLYSVLKKLEPHKVSEVLPRLAPQQRQSFIDLDLWCRDGLDVDSFEFWIETYYECQDEKIVFDFVESKDFALYLKGRFNIWTFDIEDPVYPDHDNFFVTDDDLLLFEYDEKFEYADQVRELIRRLYAKLGVEKAYSVLFKLTVDSFLVSLEQHYEEKKYRLAQLGFVDYFDSLDVETTYPKQELLDSAIRKKKKVTARIDDLGKKQALHSTSLVAYRNDSEIFSQELSKLQDSARVEYLQFNFIRMVNASISFNDALKDGQVALTRVGKNSKALMNLGFEYLSKKNEEGVFSKEDDESFFDYFDFIDLYRFGKTLVTFVHKDINNALKESSFDGDEPIGFLGRRLGELVDFSFESPPSFCLDENDGKASSVDNLKVYFQWKSSVQTLIDLLPFAQKFYTVFCDMRDNERLADSYYINYDVSDIDLEAVLISSFANFTLGVYEKKSGHKMGLTLSEFRQFVERFFTLKGELKASSETEKLASEFIKTYGLDEVYGIEQYLINILKDHLESYDFSELKENDYKHVGGPIILDPGQ